MDRVSSQHIDPADREAESAQADQRGATHSGTAVPPLIPDPSIETELPRSQRGSLGVLLLAIVALLGVFTTGFGTGIVVERMGAGAAAPPPTETAQAPRVIDEVWKLVHEHFVEPGKIDDQAMTTAAINGMLEPLGDDGHTRYLPPEQVVEHDQNLSGSYVGVGIQIEMRDDRIVVVAPLNESPAAAAGIRPGDVLVSVDGQSVAGLSLDEVVRLVRGEEGTTVELVFERPGQAEPVTARLRRTQLELKAVDWALLPGGVVDIRISEFIRGTSDQLTAAIEEAERAGATGIVLDLRNNPGGLVDEAIRVASAFLPPETTVFKSRVRDGSETAHLTVATVRRTDLPLVVLVNEGTASAAEIVSGALQEHQRAPLVGVPTFGTGTVLSQYTLSDGSALLLGTELWMTPDGDLIRDSGISPDYRVEQPEGVWNYTPVTGMPVNEDVAQDAQLSAALGVLRGTPPPSGARTSGGCLMCS
ncbi:MAG: S41 family peptidase [Sphaerobacter sp.]|nr:S41 family peptidase [Sphaerobacter sp.]